MKKKWMSGLIQLKGQFQLNIIKSNWFLREKYFAWRWIWSERWTKAAHLSRGIIELFPHRLFAAAISLFLNYFFFFFLFLFPIELASADRKFDRHLIIFDAFVHSVVNSLWTLSWAGCPQILEQSLKHFENIIEWFIRHQRLPVSPQNPPESSRILQNPSEFFQLDKKWRKPLRNRRQLLKKFKIGPIFRKRNNELWWLFHVKVTTSKLIPMDSTLICRQRRCQLGK